MLKKFFWVLLFGSFISCQTGLVEPDPIIPPITYIVTAEVVGQGGSISPTYTVVTKGNSVSFSFTLPLGFDPVSVTINGIQSPLTSTTYSFFPNADSKLVFESKRNKFGLLIWKPWKAFTINKRAVGTTLWNNSTFDVFTYIFGNEKYYKYSSTTVFDATTLYGDGPYILMNDSLFIGFNPQGMEGIRNKVDVLTTDTLRMRYISKFFGTPKLPDTEYQLTCVH